jgi:tricarballylate dehydrogenase
MVGGVFFHDYASGTGLMSLATFGPLAGRSAAEFALKSD